MTNFTITKNWLNENKTTKGAYTRQQLSVIGIDWPPAKGWQKHVIGKVISDSDKALFEDLLITLTTQQTIKIKAMLKECSKAQILEIDRYIKRLLSMNPNEL